MTSGSTTWISLNRQHAGCQMKQQDEQGADTRTEAERIHDAEYSFLTARRHGEDDADGQEAFLVTIKLRKNPNHDPHNKVTAPCAVSESCTDTTGEHHTLIAWSQDEVEAIRQKYGHVTRVESVSRPFAAPEADTVVTREDIVKAVDDWYETDAAPVELVDAIFSRIPNAAGSGVPQCRTFSADGQQVLCDRPARYIVWGHLYAKQDKGPKCWEHAPKPKAGQDGVEQDFVSVMPHAAIYELPIETASAKQVDGRLSADTLAEASHVLDAFMRTSPEDEWSQSARKVRDMLRRAADLPIEREEAK